MCSLEWIVTLLPWRSSVCLSVCLCGTGVHCDHTVHFGVDLSLWLDRPMSWAPWYQGMSTYSQPSFSSSTWKRGGVWMFKLGVISEERLKIEVKLLLSANRKSYMLRPLAQRQMTLNDLEWPFRTLRAISAVAEFLVCDIGVMVRWQAPQTEN